jgi:hypothetical protein
LGGGISNNSFMTITNSTIFSNTLHLQSGTAALKNSIVSTLGSNSCVGGGGALTSLNNNLSSDVSCGLSMGSDITNANPLLGPLQNNGGATWTHRLLAGSPAINAGDNNGCPPADQRGIPRPQDARCDIGAHESIQLYLPVIMHQ